MARTNMHTLPDLAQVQVIAGTHALTGIQDRERINCCYPGAVSHRDEHRFASVYDGHPWIEKHAALCSPHSTVKAG